MCSRGHCKQGSDVGGFWGGTFSQPPLSILLSFLQYLELRIVELSETAELKEIATLGALA